MEYRADGASRDAHRGGGGGARGGRAGDRRAPEDHYRAVHGGTLMAFADTIGAVGTSAMGLKTATLESKTNFFAAATAGKLRAESTALHKGRRTHVWQTRVTDDSGRLLSLTIQTQMIL